MMGDEGCPSRPVCAVIRLIVAQRRGTEMELFQGCDLAVLHLCFFIVARILSTSAMYLSASFWNYCALGSAAVILELLSTKIHTPSVSDECFPNLPFFTLAWWCLRSWMRVFSASR